MTFISAEVQWMPDEFLIGVTWYPFAFELPSYYERRRVWADLLEGAAVSAAEIDAIAGRFVLDKKRITDVVLHTKMLKNSSEVTIDAIYDTCRSRIYRKMGVYARRLIPRYRLKDIVLPDDQMHHLQEICSHLRHRHTVYFKWGFENRFALGKGLNILFSGSSGTGKTMAADIIANEFKLDLYQIDLSAIVSKYIGETEKNLSRIFKEASSGNLILFFDEADALFGKRSEVKDAHDRYANIEIDYLLQKMEDHEGIVILATNLSKNIDEAFLRRLHFSLEFPFPDENQRLLIWKKIFPPETPIEADIEFSFLAERFSLSGGNIKNVAMTAAFYAAEDESAVRMPHIILALKRELQKMGKLCVKADFGRYYAVLERAMSDG
jgi:ATP-dependent 26S proteasome regulatory subunit